MLEGVEEQGRALFSDVVDKVRGLLVEMFIRFLRPPNLVFGEPTPGQLLYGDNRPEYEHWIHLPIANQRKSWLTGEARNVSACYELKRNGELLPSGQHHLGIGTGTEYEEAVHIRVGQQRVGIPLFLNLLQDTNLWIDRKKSDKKLVAKGYYFTSWEFVDQNIRGPLPPGKYEVRVILSYSGGTRVSEWIHLLELTTDELIS